MCTPCIYAFILLSWQIYYRDYHRLTCLSVSDKHEYVDVKFLLAFCLDSIFCMHSIMCKVLV